MIKWHFDFLTTKFEVPTEEAKMARFVYDIMLLLTDCEVHAGKYSDRSFEVRSERSEVRTKS